VVAALPGDGLTGDELEAALRRAASIGVTVRRRTAGGVGAAGGLAGGQVDARDGARPGGGRRGGRGRGPGRGAVRGEPTVRGAAAEEGEEGETARATGVRERQHDG
jgi:hypothetical protein